MQVQETIQNSADNFIKKSRIYSTLDDVIISRRLSFNPFSAGTVFRRQNLTSRDGPRTEIVKIFIMAVDP